MEKNMPLNKPIRDIEHFKSYEIKDLISYYIKLMRLYSKFQMTICCIITGLACTALGAGAFYIHSLGEEKNEPVPMAEAIAEPVAIPVAYDGGQYTQDEAQNISIYEKCNFIGI